MRLRGEILLIALLASCAAKPTPAPKLDASTATALELVCSMGKPILGEDPVLTARRKEIARRCEHSGRIAVTGALRKIIGGIGSK